MTDFTASGSVIADTIPGVFANRFRSRIVRHCAGFAVPPAARTGRRIFMPFPADRAIPSVPAGTRSRYLVNFGFAIGTIPVCCASVGYFVSVSMFGAIPCVRTNGRIFAVVARGTVGAVPIPDGTCLMIGMPRSVGIATPAVHTVFVFGVTLSFAAVAILAPPVMRTAFRLPITVFTVGTEPAVIRTNIRCRVVRPDANGTRPVMWAIFGRSQHLFAPGIGTITITVRTGCLRYRMSRLTAFAVPGMRARLPDVVSRPTGFVRAIPAVRVCRGTDNILRVVFAFRRAIPVVSARFVQSEAFDAGTAPAVHAVGALRDRNRMFVLTARAEPVMRARKIGTADRDAGFAEPPPAANP